MLRDQVKTGTTTFTYAIYISHHVDHARVTRLSRSTRESYRSYLKLLLLLVAKFPGSQTREVFKYFKPSKRKINLDLRLTNGGTIGSTTAISVAVFADGAHNRRARPLVHTDCCLGSAPFSPSSSSSISSSVLSFFCQRNRKTGSRKKILFSHSLSYTDNKLIRLTSPSHTSPLLAIHWQTLILVSRHQDHQGKHSFAMVAQVFVYDNFIDLYHKTRELQVVTRKRSMPNITWSSLLELRNGCGGSSAQRFAKKESGGGRVILLVGVDNNNSDDDDDKKVGHQVNYLASARSRDNGGSSCFLAHDHIAAHLLETEALTTSLLRVDRLD